MQLRKIWSQLTPELKYELLGIVLVTAGVIGMMSLAGFNAGPVGAFVAKAQKYLFGVGAAAAPAVVVAVGLRYIGKHSAVVYSARFFGIIMLYICFLALYHHVVTAPGREILPGSLAGGGGFIGGLTLFLLRKLFGVDGALIVLAALAVCALILATTWSLAVGMVKARRRAVAGMRNARESIACTYESVFDKAQEEEAAFCAPPAKAKAYNREADAPCGDPCRRRLPAERETETAAPPERDFPAAGELPCPDAPGGAYRMPPLSILQKTLKPKNAKVAKEVADNAQILEKTLASFHIGAKIVNACRGPSVTRYELEPAPGVKVSKIVNLADDLALQLAAPGVRIEAPIPGKAAIGVEVPNRELAGVQLREVLEGEAFEKAKSKLTVGLGKDIAGKAILADLGKMPHLLVAGATGSGKSVCVNTLITSILFKATPDEVKFLLIDPKMVELSNYNGVGHLLAPVVTDAKKAAAALNWAVQEMERRYAMFAAAGVRDMERYNNTDGACKLASIVIIIDELADLMMVAPVDVEDAICRLAQKARAAGLHLVLATQRPSVDVITGTIKANVPSRISFAVSSQIDSRTILDMTGAEKLLGRGDMLYHPVGSAKPLRVQGAFISDGEVEELLAFVRAQNAAPAGEEICFPELAAREGGANEEKPADELLEDAVRVVMETGQASASMLQRKFRIGYTRAARLVDAMEEMRIVGPNAGSKARDILMTMEQVNHTYFHNGK